MRLLASPIEVVNGGVASYSPILQYRYVQALAPAFYLPDRVGDELPRLPQRPQHRISLEDASAAPFYTPRRRLTFP